MSLLEIRKLIFKLFGIQRDTNSILKPITRIVNELKDYAEEQKLAAMNNRQEANVLQNMAKLNDANHEQALAAANNLFRA